MFRNFSTRFFIIYAFVTLIIFVVIYFGFNYFLMEQLYDMRADELTSDNQKVMSVLSDLDDFSYDHLDQRLNPSHNYFPHTLYILNLDQTVIYDNKVGEDSVTGLFIDADLIHQALSGQTVREHSTLNNTFPERTVMVASPIYIDGQISGILLNTAKSPAVGEIVDNISFTLFIILLVILGFTFTYTYFFSSKITSTISQFNITAKKIASGHLSSRVELPYTNDDIGILAKNMNTMAEELERVDTMRKEFIANISHDLRSPLTSIGGFAQAMLDGTITPENQERYLQIIITQTEHLTNLTQNILLLTQMENNIIEPEMGDFDIHRLIKKVLIQCEKRITDKNIEINLITDKDILMVNADLNQIQRVIYNLVDNAIKFSPVNSAITVETQVYLNKVHVSISDTGPGMSEADIKYMWLRFHKGDKSRGQDKGGFGIGLSIVREIIHHHNQNIDVFSQLGKGTTFVFTLDLAK